MSHHYSASQFNDAFIPIRLKNYSPFTNTPGAPYGVHSTCLPNRCCPTQIIAYDNGHLYECIPRGPSSPWGDYSTSILEQTSTCLCIDKLRHPEKWAAPKHIFIANEENNHEKEAARIAKFLNENPEEYKNMVEKNIQDCCCPPPACPCPPNPCFPMKVVLCNSEADKKRVIKEMKRQQREWRRCAAGIRGRMKGKTPFSPGELRVVTWDGCSRGGNALGKVYGCQKSGCSS
ncbi:Protein Flattop [Orchesella cincta]|uniref:Cilia- and flagella-associated protein 126 n=1 Tax=Orchesella cincta TaxID=48709 RepID=A0A1D2MNP7_ORCCI|nr:Protein Flattop [Orchesella cincta]